MEQITEYIMSDQEKKRALSAIAKLSNLGKPGVFESSTYRDYTRLVWAEDWKDRISFSSFEKQIHQWGTGERKVKTDNQAPTTQTGQMTFIGLCVFLAETMKMLPSDKFLNVIAVYFGWSKSIAGITRKSMEEKGYRFTKQKDGSWKVKLPEPQPEPSIEPVKTITDDDIRRIVSEVVKSLGYNAA